MMITVTSDKYMSECAGCPAFYDGVWEHCSINYILKNLGHDVEVQTHAGPAPDWCPLRKQNNSKTAFGKVLPPDRVDIPPGNDSVRMANQCVACGQEMPEGGHVCVICRSNRLPWEEYPPRTSSGLLEED